MIWGKPCRLQKVLPSTSGKIELNWMSSHYLLAMEFDDDSKSLGG